MVYLKQSTAVTLLIGPFVDDTDGKTAETGLTISQADVRLSKNGGNMAQKNESTSCTHDELGYYTCPLDTTDTNTLGILKVMVHESGALPVWVECMVVTANWWDTMCSTDQLDVNVTNIEGSDATDQINAACDSALTDYDAATGTELAAVDAKIDTIDGIVDDILVDTGTTLQAELDGIQADTEDIQTQIGTAGAGLTAVPWNAAWDAEVQSEVTDGLNAYDPPTKAELDSGLAGLNDPTAASIADAVWDEAQADHVGAGTFGEVATETAAILADTNELQTDDIPGTLTTIEGKIDTIDGIVDDIVVDTGTTLPGTLTTMDGKLDTIDNFLDTEIAAILEDTGTTLPAAIAALNDISVADIRDAALAQATYAPQEAPPVNATIGEILAYLYKAWRNKSTTDSDSYDLYADDGSTVDQTATLSDDGSTFTRGEVGSGA